jgi:hypothetical protein
VPDEWLTLVRGNPQTNAGFDFCSEQCLTQWLSGNIAPPQTDKPECKARRFIVSISSVTNQYGETEGVLWSNGRVTLEPLYDTGIHTFPSLVRLKNAYSNPIITWIDQERKA